MCFFYQCKDEEFTIGAEWVDSNNKIQFIDTITATLSTVVLDSFPTNNTGVHIVGSISDTNFGNFNSSTYFRVGPIETYNINDDYVYDSIEFILKPTSKYYGDTLKLFTLSLHKLTEPIETHENENENIYNGIKIPFENEPVGIKNFYLQPNKQNEIAIKCSNELGIELWNLMRYNDELLTSKASFIAKYPGFTLQTDEDKNSSLMYFDVHDNTLFRIYGHYIDKDIVDVSYDFKMTDAEYQFNNIERDFSQSQLRDFKTLRQEINTNKTNGYSYMLSNLGIYSKVNFPYLNNILLLKNILIINSTLHIKPRAQVNPIYLSAQKLFLSETNENNEEIYPIYNSSGNHVNAYVNYDYLFEASSSVDFDITEYFANKYRSSYFDADDGLIITSSESFDLTHLDYCIFDGNSNNNFMKLYYLVYE